MYIGSGGSCNNMRFPCSWLLLLLPKIHYVFFFFASHTVFVVKHSVRGVLNAISTWNDSMKIQCTWNENENTRTHKLPLNEKCVALAPHNSMRFSFYFQNTTSFFLLVFLLDLCFTPRLCWYYARCCTDLKVISMYFSFYELAIQQTTTEWETKAGENKKHTHTHSLSNGQMNDKETKRMKKTEPLNGGSRGKKGERIK